MPDLERRWFFQGADGVPTWIKLWTGSAARRRTLQALEEEYDLEPAQRFKLIEDSLGSWNIPWLTAVKIPTPEPSSPWWYGGRDCALSHPVIRSWYHHENAQVFHGTEAFEVVQREWSKWR